MSKFVYGVTGTAPDRDYEYVEVSADSQTEGEYRAREELADKLGVRAEHVVLRVIETYPAF